MITRRRWLQISLRGLLALLTVFAIWLGIVANRAREQREAIKVIEASGGSVLYKGRSTMGVATFGGKVIQAPPGDAPTSTDWLRRLLGDNYVQEVDTVLMHASPQNEQNAQQLVPLLKNFRTLKHLYILFPISEHTRQELEVALPHCNITVNPWPEPRT